MLRLIPPTAHGLAKALRAEAVSITSGHNQERLKVTAANWAPHIMNHCLGPARDRWNLQAWGCVASVLALLVMTAFLVEMATFQAPGESLRRISLTVGIAAYLGLLGSFLAQLRWLPDLDGGSASGKRATRQARRVYRGSLPQLKKERLSKPVFGRC